MGQTLTLQVGDMHCGVCAHRLDTVLGRLDGVGAVDADHTTGVVRVWFDPSRTAAGALTAAAVERIERAGFTVAGDQDGNEGARS
jgi:copper chaperone CopZ